MRASRAISARDIVAVVGKFKEQDLPKIHARVARQELERVLSAAPAPYTTFVDGREGAALESVKPGGQILFKFNRQNDVLQWIFSEVVARSPIGPDIPPHLHYYQDHEIFVDGALIKTSRSSTFIGTDIVLKPNSVVEFVNTRPYARRLENGWSRQAPNGVYEIVALAAQRRFPGTRIQFDYVSMPGLKYRYPSISVRA